jgi:hypothetical protein
VLNLLDLKNSLDFNSVYSIVQEKIALKLWSIDFAKGYLSCYLTLLKDLTDDNYNVYAKLIDDL